MARHRQSGVSGGLADFQAASSFWRSQVATQCKLMAFMATITILAIASASYPWGSNPPPLSEALGQVSLNGGLRPEQALVVIASLASLVGALSVALVVAPRVDDERTLVDRLALARWGQYITRLNATTAGISAGIAITQLGGPPSPQPALMTLLSGLICAVSAISVQRLHDAVHGQLASSEVLRIEEALERLGAESALRVRTSKRADLMRSLLSYCIYMVSLLVTAIIIDAQNMTVQEFFSWREIAAGLDLILVTIGVSAFLTTPWQMALRWRIRRKAFKDTWHRWWWLTGCATSALVLFVLFLPGEPEQSWKE
jgi:hypothetical protein